MVSSFASPEIIFLGAFRSCRSAKEPGMLQTTPSFQLSNNRLSLAHPADADTATTAAKPLLPLATSRATPSAPTFPIPSS